ncbi:MAG TPA: hypothetical protein ENJ27_00775 [Candidatus Moranbacteria bacterium]|nr:hypothetical protein [Candidatus Moranbacteria bacterium]
MVIGGCFNVKCKVVKEKMDKDLGFKKRIFLINRIIETEKVVSEMMIEFYAQKREKNGYGFFNQRRHNLDKGKKNSYDKGKG